MAHPPAVLRERPLFRRWLLVVTTGEFLGFAVPAVAGAVTAGGPALVALGVLLAAGAVEGTALGLAQASVLRRALPPFPVRPWVLATAGGAVLAYAIGMLPATLGDRWAAVPAAALVLIGAVLGAALLATIGTAQWLVLRTVLRRSASWILTTALAWLAGLTVFLGFTMPLWHPGQPVALVAAIGAAGGLLMAAVTAAVTGAALRRLVRAGTTGRSALSDPVPLS